MTITKYNFLQSHIEFQHVAYKSIIVTNPKISDQLAHNPHSTNSKSNNSYNFQLIYIQVYFFKGQKRSDSMKNVQSTIIYLVYRVFKMDCHYSKQFLWIVFGVPDIFTHHFYGGKMCSTFFDFWNSTTFIFENNCFKTRTDPY